jgi:hypothetical protein
MQEAGYDSAAYDTTAHDLPTQGGGYGVQQRPVLDLHLWPCVRTQNMQETDNGTSAYDNNAADAHYHKVPAEAVWNAMWQ